MSDQSTPPKKIDIKDLRASGYLQEVNRLFFHPLGLALAVKVDSATGEEVLDCVWDCREDPQGIVFGIASTDAETIKDMMAKAAYIQEEWTNRGNHRQNTLGFALEPITLNP